MKFMYLELYCCCCRQVTSVVSDSVRPHRRQPTRLSCPWDSPGKNTGVGCHFLLQCMKAKSESEVAQSCATLSDPMDCSPPGSSVHGIFQARVLEWVPWPSPQNCTRFPFYTSLPYVCMLSCFSHVCYPLHCSLLSSSVHGILQARILQWVPVPLFQGIFLTQRLNLRLLWLLHCRQILYC